MSNYRVDHRSSQRCSLLLVNAKLGGAISRERPSGAIAIREGRIVAVGGYSQLRDLADEGTEVVDAEGGVAIPAFHDAHMHVLSYARQAGRVDCGGLTSVAAIKAALAERAAALEPKTGWVRGVGYDDRCLTEEGRHPDRWDLDAAVPDHPTRLQHRSQHLDVLNTAALHSSGLLESSRPEVERDPVTGAPTGRLFHAAELLHAACHDGDATDLEADVAHMTQRLLAWGITSIQDASVTNGPAEWELFHRLHKHGVLRVRTFVFAGHEHWRDVHAGEPASGQVRHGPVKFMLAESQARDVRAMRAELSDVRQAGFASAIHAVSEAELAVALDVLGSVGARRAASPNRIEHAACVPDALLADIRSLGVTVVGQPALIHTRGDVYLEDHAADQHAWLYRAGSFAQAGVAYAVGSDAPIGDPAPGLALYALVHRSTAGGAVMGADERLSVSSALGALTREPASAVGVDHELGRLAPGYRADIAVLDPDTANGVSLEAARRDARITIKDGAVVWRRR